MRLKGVKKSEGRAYKQNQKAVFFWLGFGGRLADMAYGLPNPDKVTQPAHSPQPTAHSAQRTAHSAHGKKRPSPMLHPDLGFGCRQCDSLATRFANAVLLQYLHAVAHIKKFKNSTAPVNLCHFPDYQGQCGLYADALRGWKCAFTRQARRWL
jgi:hypothetical protein